VLAEGLGGLVKDGRTTSVEVRKINGAEHDDTTSSVVAITALLEQHGFVRGYRGLVRRD
jgi:dihydroxyacetone kinase DhaKLM complex PTS-EIIA-like component DhaM